MKNLVLAMMITLLTATTVPARAAEDANVTAVATAVEHMRQAMLSRDRVELEKIPGKDLIYIHSDGRVENAKQFVDALVARHDEYLDAAFNNQTITASGTTAVVTHTFDVHATAKNVNEGKPYYVHIGVVQVWKKEGNDWKLFARKAFRIAF